MLRRPDVDEVMEYGRALGFDLTPTEARMIQARMMDTVAALEAFDEMRVEERRPPLRFTDRDPGAPAVGGRRTRWAPSSRTCRVKGADSGPLHGKTVALKDHIALAGVPLTFSSHMMDGYVPDFDATVVTRLLDAGRHHRRQAQDGGVLVGRPRALRRGRLRPPAQPAQPRARHRRLVVGIGRGGGGRAGGHRARRRSGRLDPAARRVVRHRRD